VLRAHEADVISSVPAERLLVFELGDSWEPLCAFLGVAVPDEPFPHANSAAEFRVWTGLDASG
jgi:Sulfotransferase domain